MFLFAWQNACQKKVSTLSWEIFDDNFHKKVKRYKITKSELLLEFFITKSDISWLDFAIIAKIGYQQKHLKKKGTKFMKCFH
jgi:hypothetical protein